jgi:HK97 family phage major capsid protein
MRQYEQQSFDSGKAELEKLERDIGRAEFLDAAERRMVGQPVTGTGDDRLDAELCSFSLVRAILTQVPGHNVDCGRERELSAEVARRSGRTFQGIAVPMSVFHEPIEQRVITTLLPGGGPGSNIISTDLLGNQFIDRLRAALRVRQLGATVLAGLTGNIDVPRLKASATAGWVAENTAITPSDAQFEKVSLVPKHVGAITEFSRNMLLQSSPDIEQLIRRDFAGILAEQVDDVAIEGGAANQPTGILGTAGVGDVPMGANGGPPTWIGVLGLIAELELDNAAGGAFLTNPKAVKKMRSTVKVATTDSVMIQEAPNSLAGYPLASTNLVPSDLTKGTSVGVCSALIFGNFGDLLLGYWSELDVLVNPYESTAFGKGNILIRAMITMDVDVRHPESFAATKDMTTT